ncbi:MAG: class I SAM-dependent methyltransferase [Deltaproteobacteria bacterium]|nr:class I SAM-dependent methyltransferase [Deltaproteobacteria bacterium]
MNHKRLDRLKKEERQWQDEIGNELIEQSYRCDGTRLVFESQFDKIISKIDIENGFSILEVGCGRGQLINCIYEKFILKGIKFFGLDLSSKLVEVKQKYRNRSHWIVADGEKLPFNEKAFNVVIYNGSLHHMPNVLEAMHETFRVIRQDGHIILFEPVSTIFSRTVHKILDPFIFKTVKYESPVDEYCKDNFRLTTLKKIIIEAGYLYTKSWHDFLAYPLTGCYAGTYFSNKPVFLKLLLKIEFFLQNIPLFRNLCNLFCWRILIDIYRK